MQRLCTVIALVPGWEGRVVFHPSKGWGWGRVSFVWERGEEKPAELRRGRRQGGPIPTRSHSLTPCSALQLAHHSLIHSLARPLARSISSSIPRSAHSTRTVHSIRPSPSISTATDPPAFTFQSPAAAAGLIWVGSMEGDDKWKLSKKGRSRSGRNYYYGDASGASTSAGTSGGLSRSYSASVTATRDGAGASGSGGGSSSSEQQKKEEADSRRRLSKKCVEAVKEHRARFYIVRRCVSMLVCWRDY
ncbi:uncharacterized protein LOC119273301 [Triticum dicoccoides]|uniref:uncharacterized protein LOC119273301 n=1 Tax=Triticum dicoccoides TaxID=85692 RepID=UPI00188F5F30|nr:uncharacterized protein LOC119273301 [Triticum dicoccoides]